MRGQALPAPASKEIATCVLQVAFALFWKELRLVKKKQLLLKLPQKKVLM